MEIPRLRSPGATSFRGRVLGALCAVLCAVPACRGPGGDEAPARAAADPEGVLWGGGRCREGSDCPSGLCTAGLCLGYLAASTEESRDAVAPAVRAAAAGAGAAATAAALQSVLEDPESDEFVRARAADAFRHLPGDLARQALAPRLRDASEPVRFFAARALAASGDPGGREALQGFRDHPSEAVRTLARTALGGPAPAAAP